MTHNQLELFSIPNPCLGICETNRRGYCMGCLRSREERFNWHAKPPAEQRRIIELLSRRKARVLAELKQRQLIDLTATEIPVAAYLQPDLFDTFVPSDESN